MFKDKEYFILDIRMPLLSFISFVSTLFCKQMSLGQVVRSKLGDLYVIDVWKS